MTSDNRSSLWTSAVSQHALSAALLTLVYSPVLLTRFAFTDDYENLLRRVSPLPRMFHGWIGELFIYNESTFLIKIGRILEAVLVSLQYHFIDTVRDLDLFRLIGFAVLVATYFGLARIFRANFGVCQSAAAILALLICLTPPFQLAVFQVAEMVPFFFSLWTAIASYLIYARCLRASEATPWLLWRRPNFIWAVVFMVASVGTYPVASMIFMALALLEFLMADTSAINAALRLTIAPLTITVGSLAILFVLHKILFEAFFVDNPMMAFNANAPNYYKFSLQISSVGNRVYNFMVSYRNAASLWDMRSHPLIRGAVTTVILASLLYPMLRFMSGLVAAGRGWRKLLRHFDAGRELVLLAFKATLFVSLFLPFLIPDQRATWENGYRDSYRTLAAVEAGMLFLGYDLMRRLPFMLIVTKFPTRYLSVVIHVGRSLMVALVLAAAAGAYWSVNLGTGWSSFQYNFYQALLLRIRSENIHELIMPCDEINEWIWITPGVPAEYGFTGLGWQDYLIREAAMAGRPVEFQTTCGATDTAPGMPYVVRTGDTLTIDYSRLVREYYARFSAGGWAWPSSHRATATAIAAGKLS